MPQRLLLINALRMRPDRIIMGEVPRRRSGGHAPGHEHRPRRLADHDPLELAARLPEPARDHDRDGEPRPARARHAAADRERGQRRDPGEPPRRRHPQAAADLRDRRDGRRRDHHAGHLRLRAPGHRRGRQGPGAVQGHGHPAQVRRPPQGLRHRPGRHAVLQPGRPRARPGREGTDGRLVHDDLGRRALHLPRGGPGNALDRAPHRVLPGAAAAAGRAPAAPRVHRRGHGAGRPAPRRRRRDAAVAAAHRGADPGVPGPRPDDGAGRPQGSPADLPARDPRSEPRVRDRPADLDPLLAGGA